MKSNNILSIALFISSGYLAVSINDELLLAKVKKGDPEAIESLLSSCEKKIYNISYRMMGNEADAMDMAQEAMIKIYTNITKFKEQSSLSSWIYRLTVNACLDGLRKRKNNTISFEESLDKGLTYKNEHTDEDPESATLNSELLKSVEEALSKIEPDQKAVVVLRDINGYTYDEIAQILDISLGTVKSRLYRGRDKMKNILVSENTF